MGEPFTSKYAFWTYLDHHIKTLRRMRIETTPHATAEGRSPRLAFDHFSVKFLRDMYCAVTTSAATEH